MRRVLVIIQTPTYGGPHNQVRRLHRPLRDRGWATEVVLPTESGNAAERLVRDGITVFHAPMCRIRRTLRPGEQLGQWRHAISGLAALRSILDDRSPDVVQICGLLTLQGAWAARSAKTPIVWQLLSTFAPRPLRAALTPLVTRWADAIMSTGVETARQHPGLAASDVVEFYPPVDVSRWSHDPELRAAARARLGVPDGAVLVATVGNFNRQKCHEWLVEIARRLRRSESAVCFRLLGAPTAGQSDYYVREVIRRADRYGLTRAGDLQFIDAGDDVSKLIHAVDVFALTSRAEGVPTALLEAMAAGVPAVAMDVGSVGEAIADGQTGFVVPVGDLDQFTVCLRRLVRDQCLRVQMGQASALRAREAFSTERCADRHAHAFELALDRAARARRAPDLERESSHV